MFDKSQQVVVFDVWQFILQLYFDDLFYVLFEWYGYLIICEDDFFLLVGLGQWLYDLVMLSKFVLLMVKNGWIEWEVV